MNSVLMESMGLGNVDIFYLFLALAIIIFILLIVMIIQTVMTANLRKRFKIFMSGRNAMSLENGIASIYKDITMLKEHDLKFRSDIKEIKTNLLDCYQKIGVVKYDAFREMGGQLSFSIALLDKEDNGFILNSVHSANGCYTYTKEIQNGVCAINLADEEKEALNRAMKATNLNYSQPKTDYNGQQMDDRPKANPALQTIYAGQNENDQQMYAGGEMDYEQMYTGGDMGYPDQQADYDMNGEPDYYEDNSGYGGQIYNNGYAGMNTQDNNYNA
ncbi:MAG: DUF4446 family protein [Lachnospiraceae bacterium]|nr:DUF4446 family protein [Lachnospiraceae bacterium]